MSGLDGEYARIADLLVAMHDDVEHGKMMSAPAITCCGKVFAFRGKEGMGFRLGPDSDPTALGIADPQPLSPFKTKPPLKGWWKVDPGQSGQWERLATVALEFTRTL